MPMMIPNSRLEQAKHSPEMLTTAEVAVLVDEVLRCRKFIAAKIEHLDKMMIKEQR